MKHHFFIVVACGCLWITSASVQGQQLPENYEHMGLYELDRACDSLAANGFTDANRADAFVQWMAANDWQSLELHNQYNLFQWMYVSAIDRQHFSARWTGFLTAAQTGAYTFKQIPVYRGLNARIKLTVGGQVALDSDQSVPIQLTAGEPIAIVVDMSHENKQAPPINDFGESAPMVVVTWKSGQSAETIIPTTAFTPPEGFAAEGAHGLKGEYFGNSKFSDLRQTRLDPALDLVWSWPPVASIHQKEANAVLTALTAKLLDGNFLSRSAAEGKLSVFEYNMWRIAYVMRATERLQLVELLMSKPDVLLKMSPASMGRLMQAIYMLPGDQHIDLLGQWALAHPQPRCQAGVFPGWGNGYYQPLNTDFYWLMGRFMQGPYTNDAELLCDRYLERPNGECNLAVAYAAAFASQLNGTPEKFAQRLDQRIDDRSVTGDKLVTWLIARAFTKGAVPGRLEPLAGYSDLESALISAESSDQKFWVLQEMVARLSSTNKSEQAKALIEQHQGEFTTPEQQQALAQWSVKADELAVTYAKHFAATKQASKAAYAKELARRRQKAIDRGDDGAAGRYAELLDTSQSSSTEQ